MGGGTECGESAEQLADKARQSLDIFSVKNLARLSASELAEVQEGRGKDDLRWSRLLMVCQRERGLTMQWKTLQQPCHQLKAMQINLLADSKRPLK